MPPQQIRMSGGSRFRFVAVQLRRRLIKGRRRPVAAGREGSFGCLRSHRQCCHACGCRGAGASRCASASSAPDVPSEVELGGALSDALVPTVRCFRPYWRALAREVRRLLLELHPQQTQQAQAEAEALPPPLLRTALAMVRNDLALVQEALQLPVRGSVAP